MRGKRGKHSLHACRVGITPAGAGKTFAFGAVAPPRRDHPRRCGENGIFLPLPISGLGSPPQVRGKRFLMNLKKKNNGITPAGAGKTKCKLSQRAFRKDHPRRCGENTPICQFSGISMGSPPQVRGKPLCSRPPTAGNRITPAGAGKTFRASHLWIFRWDHPRRCGENYQLFFPGAGLRGSPPQVRGKHVYWLNPVTLTRITPAGAGKTFSASSFSNFFRDHPRRCGENTDSGRICCCYVGSPPQVRGKRQYADKPHAMGRITPAGAGKTSPMQWGLSGSQDHPRRCGENMVFQSTAPAPGGSPPRMRGKLSKYRVSVASFGITPADAGKTECPVSAV